MPKAVPVHLRLESQLVVFVQKIWRAFRPRFEVCVEKAPELVARVCQLHSWLESDTSFTDPNAVHPTAASQCVDFLAVWQGAL